MKKYLIVGCIQGRGMDADKFYDFWDEVEAENMEDAQRQAAERKIHVDRIEEVTDDEE